MTTGTAAMMKKAVEKKPFLERWGNLSPARQEQFYRMKCSELLVAPRYSTITPEENSRLLSMRNSMKPKMNGKEHPLAEKLMMEKLVASSLISC